MRGIGRRFGATALVLAVVASTAGEAAAQSKWRWTSTLGYGGAGVGLGVLARWNSADSFDEAYWTILGGFAAGSLTGALIGGSADQRLSAGEELSSAHRGALVLGTVLAGATTGAAASALLINGDGEGTPLMSDESTFALLTAVGGAAGAWLAWRWRDDLRPRTVTVSPWIPPGGGAGVALRVRVP